MYALKVYMTSEEFDQFIKKHLSDEDLERFAECEWFPVKFDITDLMEIEVVAIPAKKY